MPDTKVALAMVADSAVRAAVAAGIPPPGTWIHTFEGRYSAQSLIAQVKLPLRFVAPATPMM